MGVPLWEQIWQRPGSSVVVGGILASFLYIHRRGYNYSDVGMSFQSVALDKEYWRCVTATMAHINLLHLLFNVSSLWSISGAEFYEYGTAKYFLYTLLLLLLSIPIEMLIYALLIYKAGKEEYLRVVSVGYSGIVFGWMTIVACDRPSSSFQFLGLFSLPATIAPFGSLILTSVLIPQASFVGHLGGILAGYVISFKVLDALGWYWVGQIIIWAAILVTISLKLTTSLPLDFIQIIPMDEDGAVAMTNRVIVNGVLQVRRDTGQLDELDV